MKKIITTVGTSLITNALEVKTIDETVLRSSFETLKGKSFDEGDEYGDEINDLNKELERFIISTDSKISAETHSVSKIVEEFSDEEVEVIFICSDTILSHRCALHLNKWFSQHLPNIRTSNPIIIDGLQVKIAQDFKEKVFNKYVDTIDQQVSRVIKLKNISQLLVECLEVSKKRRKKLIEQIIGFIDKNENIHSDNLVQKVLEQKRSNNKTPWEEFIKESLTGELEVVNSTSFLFNVSGGFKANIPILTIIGQLYHIPLIYIYEESDELITIDSLPIQFDFSKAEEYHRYLELEFLTDQDVMGRDSNKRVIENLLSDKLIAPSQLNGGYEVTTFGLLLKRYIENMTLISKNLIGIVVEYKLYEYFIENTHGKYKKVVHSREIPNKAEKAFLSEDIKEWIRGLKVPQEEVDLEMSTPNGSNYVLCEIKSFYQVTNTSKENTSIPGKEKIVERAKARLEFWSKLGKKVDEYLLVFYKNDFNDISEVDLEFYKNAGLNVPIRLFYFDIKMDKTGYPYKSFLMQEIDQLIELPY